MENNQLSQVKHVSVSINKNPDEVYQFASNAENMQQWAPGFVKSITKDGNAWLAKTTLGDVKIEFAPQNQYGVVDHKVTLPSGETIANPMRVLPNGKGSEMVFSVFRLPGFSDAEFERDWKTVESDLKKLKEVMEQE